MPDASRGLDLDNLRLVGGVLGTVSFVTLVGSWISYATGDEFRGGRTHMDAVLVLLFIGIALALATTVVFLERRDRRSS